MFLQSFSIESDADASKQLVGTYDPILGETAYGLPVYKKRGTERWLQCSSHLSSWVVQSKDTRNTLKGFAYSPQFSSIYEFKLPHELTGQWWIQPNDRKIPVKIDLKITTQPTSYACHFNSSGSIPVCVRCTSTPL